MNRIEFLKAAGTLGLALNADPCRPEVFVPSANEDFTTWPQPNLKKVLTEPIILEAVELLKTQGQLMLVVTAKDGTKGITQCNDRMQHLHSLLKGLVLPHFIDQDARSIVTLTDNAYRLNSNYKYAGMPLWNCIGSVEIAVWDLLGKLAKQPVYQLLGNPIRKEYDIYISDFYRGGEPAEEVVDRLAEKIKFTGATGIKIKVGGRMNNTPEDDQRTRAFIPLIRKKLGDSLIVYADGNGSFTPEEGINTGKYLQEYGVTIFEEPCNFEDEDGMRKVNHALKEIKVAGGEQDSSLYRFERLAGTDVYDILQPDLYYNGGIFRTLHVAEIARKFKKAIAPHTPKSDPLIGPFWQVAALVPNLYGLQEFVLNLGEPQASWYTPIVIARGGKIQIPSTPGLGISYDDGIWKNAEKIV